MKMQKIFTCFVLAITTAVQVMGQAPVIKWQKTYGGTYADNLYLGTKLSLIDRDGKYIIGCTTNSNDGDMTGNHSSFTPPFYQYDTWIAKVEAPGNKIWSGCVGYAGNEHLHALKLAEDSGYIMIGSYAPGDRNRIVTDIWVVRLGNTGNIVWEKKLGVPAYDEGRNITPIPDGYILIGTTYTEFDAFGNHGVDDLWVAKLDKSGNLIWGKTLGGTNREYATDVQPTADGGYIVTGSTTSTNGDVQGSHGATDVWVVKLDGNGNIQWQKCLGGTGSEVPSDIECMADGSFIIAGQTNSQDGDVTGNHVSDGSTLDAWVIHLSASGEMLWQKCFGGSGNEAFYDIRLLPDQNFIVVGETNSSDGDVSHVYGQKDCWLVKFDATGNIMWETTFGTADNEVGITWAPLPNGNFIIAGNTVVNLGFDDLWLFEVGPDIVAGPLPVTLLSFEATQSNSEVNLTWKTNLEQNFSHFEVQRSANGIDFTTIGIVQAVPPSYLFKDKQPLPGINYYRLKSVDSDNSYDYSTIATVNIKESRNIISSLYPNPGNGSITLQLQGAVHGPVTMQVLDQYGRIVTTKQFGNQHTTRFIVPVNLSHLPNGNYILKMMVDDKIYLHKLLIQ